MICAGHDCPHAPAVTRWRPTRHGVESVRLCREHEHLWREAARLVDPLTGMPLPRIPAPPRLLTAAEIRALPEPDARPAPRRALAADVILAAVGRHPWSTLEELATHLRVARQRVIPVLVGLASTGEVQRKRLRRFAQVGRTGVLYALPGVEEPPRSRSCSDDVLALLDRGPLSVCQIAGTTGHAKRTVRRVLVELMGAGLTSRFGRGAATRWALARRAA